MVRGRIPDDELVRIDSGRHRAPGWIAAAAILCVVASLGVLGKLVPAPRALPVPSSSSAAPSAVADDGVRLISPVGGVVWWRATEVAVIGTVPPEVERVEATVSVDGRVLGSTVIAVDAEGRIHGAVPFVPPPLRTLAMVTLTDEARPDDTLAEVTVSLEAGALLLVRNPSDLVGTGGRTMIVDVLVYGELREIRGLITSRGGMLITSASSRPGRPRSGAGDTPRMVALELEIPGTAPTGRARLHVLGVAADGAEVEHIDANVQIAPPG